jgi:hypothetical protein
MFSKTVYTLTGVAFVWCLCAQALHPYDVAHVHPHEPVECQASNYDTTDVAAVGSGWLVSSASITVGSAPPVARVWSSRA